MDEYISKTKFEKLMRKKARKNFAPSAIGYIMAASEAHDFPSADVQPAPQWISVEERLPNHYEEVLVVSKLKNIVYFAWYDADISMFMGHGHMWTTREVTHWMPLPEPPKE